MIHEAPESLNVLMCRIINGIWFDFRRIFANFKLQDSERAFRRKWKFNEFKPLMQYITPSISSVKFSISQLSLQIRYLISLNLFGYSIRLCIFRSRFLGTQPFVAPIIHVDCIQSKSLAKFQRNTSTK